jgi:hypothetical protein
MVIPARTSGEDCEFRDICVGAPTVRPTFNSVAFLDGYHP